MNRRTFLKLFGYAGGAVALAKYLPEVGTIEEIKNPQIGKATAVLYGDGIHDDTRGLQALFDGKPVLNKQTRMLVPNNYPSITIPHGEYKTSSTLHIKGRDLIIRGKGSKITASTEVSPVIQFDALESKIESGFDLASLPKPMTEYWKYI